MTTVRDVVVVGAGIIGLAVAREILRRRPGASVLVLEAADDVATGQTGHNSGVVHAGLYYPPGSLKARLARAGTRAIEEFARGNDTGVKNIGKLLVATDPAEAAHLAEIEARAAANNVPTRRLSGPEVTEWEPNVRAVAGLFSPRTSIVDYAAMARALKIEIEERGGQVRMNSPVRAITEDAGGVRVRTREHEHRASLLVACGGVQSDRLARMGGLEVDFRIVPFRGEYFSLPRAKRDFVSRLIYPVPDPSLPFLGVHLSPTTGGRITVGPSAVLGLARTQGRRRIIPRDAASTLAFPGFWRFAARNLPAGIAEMRRAASKRAYAREVRRITPALTAEDLRPYPAGTRAQAMARDGRLVDDFLIKATARQIHVCNAPSPAATAALPIAAKIFEDYLSGRSPFEA